MFLSCIDPNDYLDLPDDSAMIQAAVDEAAKIGAAVAIPRVNKRTNAAIWNISRTVDLYTGSVVYLDNCHLRLIDGSFCNIFKNSIARTEQAGDAKNRQYDIRISGFGNALLDGGTHNRHVDRDNWCYVEDWGIPTDYYDMFDNLTIHFHNVERVVIENLRIVNHRFWGIAFNYCSNGRVSNIDFECDKNFINLDGVDLRVGCHDFLIENISGKTGDDMVALTNLGDYLSKDADLSADISNVIIRNIRAKLIGNHALVRLLCDRGMTMHNIQIDGVIDLSEPGEALHRPFAAIRIGDPIYSHGEGRMHELGDMRHIIVRNVMTRAQMAVYVCQSLQDSIIDGVQLCGDPGIAVAFYNAHAENVTIRDVQYGTDAQKCTEMKNVILEPDNLSSIYFQNSQCKGLRIDGLSVGQGVETVFTSVGSDADIELSGLINKHNAPFVKGEGISINVT
jgi:hypothetical protein